MRLLVTVIAYLVSLVAVATISLVVILLLAGPHAGVVGEPMEMVVLAIGWLTVLGLPAYIAYRVWRKLGERPRS